MRKSPMVVLMSAVGLLLTQSAHSAPPTSPIIGEAATARPVPPGGTNVPGGSKILYVGPTPDLTAVANALQVQAKSLESLSLLWQNFWIDRRHWIPESGFQ
jgi:hypothetical protein